MNDRELIRTVLDAANRNEMEAVDALVHEDFLGVVPPSMSAEPDTYAGPAGVRRYFDLFRETVDNLVIRVDDFEQVGDSLIVIAWASGTGRASGVPVAIGVALAAQVRDGKVFRMEAFPDLEEARRELESR
jgi:ketosteroid isomerase-like protein